MGFSLSPTSQLLGWLAGWTLLGLAPVFWPVWLPYWLLAGSLLLAIAAQDAFALHLRPPLQVERLISPALPLGTWQAVRLRITNSQRYHRATLFRAGE